MVGKIVVAIISIVLLSSALGGAAYASYRGYGLVPATSESARVGSTRGIFIIGGGPSGGGK